MHPHITLTTLILLQVRGRAAEGYRSVDRHKKSDLTCVVGHRAMDPFIYFPPM